VSSRGSVSFPRRWQDDGHSERIFEPPFAVADLFESHGVGQVVETAVTERVRADLEVSRDRADVGVSHGGQLPAESATLPQRRRAPQVEARLLAR
jgi:hypothetical protein